MINLLRWIAVLPLAIISATVIPVALRLLTYIGIFNYRGTEISSFFLELSSSFIMGAVFVYVGKQIAPSDKKITGKILFVISIFIVGFLFIFNWQLGEKLAAFYSLPLLVGAYFSMEYDK
ncbi:hypothetical protein AB7360_03445 [Providencia alcalifaciens]|uniref:hypothetical protein n=1 Tax=Providencia alcalifaciens TaxID=126385 RepID=UPI0032DA4E39